MFSIWDVAEAPEVAVFEYQLWQRKFGGDISASGGTLVLNGSRSRPVQTLRSE